MFQIELDQVERSSTLTKRDIGHWAMIVQGTYLIFSKDEDAARKRYNEISEILRK